MRDITPKYPVNQVYPGNHPDGQAIWDDETRRSVVEYLADESHHFLCSVGMPAVDTVTGEKLPWYEDTMADEDGYYWSMTLPHYIQEHGWLVSQGFIDHVAEKRADGWKPTRLIEHFELK